MAANYVDNRTLTERNRKSRNISSRGFFKGGTCFVVVVTLVDGRV